MPIAAPAPAAVPSVSAPPAASRLSSIDVMRGVVMVLINAWLFANHPMMNPPPPEGYTWSLGLLCLVFFIVVGALYAPCRWFARVKARRREGWLRYL